MRAASPPAPCQLPCAAALRRLDRLESESRRLQLSQRLRVAAVGLRNFGSGAHGRSAGRLLELLLGEEGVALRLTFSLSRADQIERTNLCLRLRHQTRNYIDPGARWEYMPYPYCTYPKVQVGRLLTGACGLAHGSWLAIHATLVACRSCLCWLEHSISCPSPKIRLSSCSFPNLVQLLCEGHQLLL